MYSVGEKPGIMLYLDLMEPLCNHLSDEELGKLFRGAVYFTLTGDAPQLGGGATSMAWDILLPHLLRDTERYEEKKALSRYANYCKTQKQLGLPAMSREAFLSDLL